ncbi:hypothetical protein [Trinickia symbiotica]|nr:hypothetical protein [Trinickia symbiotica]
MSISKSEPLPKFSSKPKLRALPQIGGQLCLFPNDERKPFSAHDDAQPVWTHVAMFNVCGTEYRLKPVPQAPLRAMTLTMNVMVQLQHERDSWLPRLKLPGEAITLSLKDGTECVVCICEGEQQHFVGVEKHGGKLRFCFPPPGRWADIHLDWLAAERCRCGRFDCDPAPFRRLACPEAD